MVASLSSYDLCLPQTANEQARYTGLNATDDFHVTGGFIFMMPRLFYRLVSHIFISQKNKIVLFVTKFSSKSQFVYYKYYHVRFSPIVLAESQY